MRITESRLRRVIRSVIEESWREHSKIDSIRMGKSSLEGQQSLPSPTVQDVIKFYKDNPAWNDAIFAFYDMMEGGSIFKKQFDKKYPGWTKEMYAEVIEGLEGSKNI
jgi:hypothetical protein